MRKGHVPHDSLDQLRKLITDPRVIIHAIHEDNFKPHVYQLTKKHIKFAKDNGFPVSEESVMMFEADNKKKKPKSKCGFVNCQHTYKQHTFERGIFFRLTENITQAELTEIFKPLDPLIKEYEIDGFQRFIKKGEEDFNVLP